MFKTFLVTLGRQLWRNRLFTSLNILGLSVCICVAWIIFRIVSYEYSFDKKVPEAQNIYQLISKSKSANNPEGGFAGIPKPVLGALKNEISGLEMVVPMFYKYQHRASVQQRNKEPLRNFENPEEDISVVSTFPEYFSLLNYHWIAGNAATALDAPNKVVLTDARAREYFPSLSPNEVVGKTITYDDTIIRHVSAVVAQLNYPNSFSKQNNEFIAIDKSDLTDDNWGGANSNDLIFIKPAKGVTLQQVLRQLNKINLQHNKENYAKYQYEGWFDAFSVKEKHFQTFYGPQTRTASKTLLKGLMIIGAFLLILACINYINLSTAQLPQRAREIGIRKTLGSSAGDLILRFIAETFIVTALAALLSFLFTKIAVSQFADFLPDGLFDYMNYGGLTGFMFILISLISLFCGFYPAWLSTKVNTVNVLKGVTEKVIGKNRVSLRKGLIVFQFFIAQVFIFGSIIIQQQMHYALNKDLGFDKNRIVTIDVPYYIADVPQFKDKQFVLKTELSKSHAIEGVSIGKRPMDNSMMSNLMNRYQDSTEVQEQVHLKFGDTDYLSVYGFRLLAGRNFHASDTMNEIVINEKAVQAFGFKSPQDAIGQILSDAGRSKSYPIVGVVSNFHQFGVRSEINPALITSSKGQATTINIKLPGEVTQWNQALKAVERSWKQLYPGIPFTYKFYDETIKNLYADEQKMQKLVKTATILAILISCLGLFGLATLTAFQRTKEVGIRKVLGASVPGIVRLLSREFVWLVLISVVIASPVSWWLMSQWLQDFAYRIDIQWWMFIIAAFMAITIAVITVSYQAIKAAIANPVKSLRTE